MNLDFDDYEDVYKTQVIVIGNSGTGKTNIVQTFCNQKRSNNTIPTVGIEYYSKTISIEGLRKSRCRFGILQDRNSIAQQLWGITTVYCRHYRKSVGALVVFDVTNRRSFEQVSEWLHAARERGESNIQIFLIGNKIDCELRSVSKQDGDRLAIQQGVLYFQTTIMDYQTLIHAFQKLIEDIYRGKKHISTDISKNNIQLELPHQKEETTCQC